MTNRPTRDDGASVSETPKSAERATFPSSDVGVTLKVSDEALKKLDRIQEQNIKAAQEDKKFAWR